MEDSAILYQNAARTVFLIDIPTSIALTQELRPSPQRDDSFHEDLRITTRRKKYLLSSPPLRVPYPAPPEPKTDAARARILERIPAAERSFHAEVIEPLVRNGLRELHEEYARGKGQEASWCLPRRILEEEDGSDAPGSSSSNLERKRKPAKREDDALSAMSCALIEPDHAYTTSQRHKSDDEPPLILSPSLNDFENLAELKNLVVKNTSSEPAIIRIRSTSGIEGREVEEPSQSYRTTTFNVAPKSAFLLCTLPIARRPEELLPSSKPIIIPGLPADKKFNLILLDPPWPNRSVRRSAQYHTHQYSDMDTLTRYIGDILRMHLYTPDEEDRGREKDSNQNQKSQESIAAIWVTNTEKSRMAAYDAIHAAGLTVCEEWVWIKTTVKGEPATPVDGLWRKPYEILIIGKRSHDPGGRQETTSSGKTRRVIAAVPDVHSRKPNLKDVFERVFFFSSSSPSQNDGTLVAGSDANNAEDNSNECRHVEYTAMEVFARNLTAGWWACGNEVLKFNWDDWWVDE
ncbi:hypothetical protein VTN00DRAFT_9998 [Thermoascus crustaceus]|uniref:uncharacterized protein n=1 Tax=Thermoascus crustaceus TaxID=5088 RepID=UPI003743FDEF